MSKKRKKNKKNSITKELGKDAINPAELGRRVAATMFAACLNPAHRFVVGNWLSLPALAGDRAEAAAKNVLRDRVSGTALTRIAMAMRKAAVDEARRLVEDAALVGWCEIAPGPEDPGVPPTDREILSDGACAERSENEDLMEVLHDDGTFRVQSFKVRIPEGEKGCSNNGDYYQFVACGRIVSVVYFDPDHPFNWKDWGARLSADFAKRARKRLSDFQSALDGIYADVDAVDAYEGWSPDSEPEEKEPISDIDALG